MADPNRLHSTVRELTGDPKARVLSAHLIPRMGTTVRVALATGAVIMFSVLAAHAGPVHLPTMAGHLFHPGLG